MFGIHHRPWEAHRPEPWNQPCNYCHQSNRLHTQDCPLFRVLIEPTTQRERVFQSGRPLLPPLRSDFGCTCPFCRCWVAVPKGEDWWKLHRDSCPGHATAERPLGMWRWDRFLESPGHPIENWGKRPPLPWGSFGRVLNYYSADWEGR